MAWGRANSGSSVFIARKHMQSDVGRKGRTGCESRTQKQRDKLARQAAAQIRSLGTDFLSWNGSFKVQTAMTQLVTQRSLELRRISDSLFLIT